MRPDPRALTSIAAVAILGAVEGLQGYGVSLLTPEIAGALKVTVVTIVTARVVSLILGAVLPLIVPTVSASRRLAVRVWTCRVGALVCALSLALTGEVKSTGALVAVLSLTAVASAPSRGLHRSMVAAEADAGFRVSALSVLQLAMLAAQLGLALGIATGALDSWHQALEVLGSVSVIVVVLCSFALRPTARYDGADDVTIGDSPVEPSRGQPDSLVWKEIARSWRATPSLAGIGVATLAVGMLLMPFDAFFSIFLHHRWHLGMRGTAVVFLIVATTSIVLVLLNAARADRLLVAAPGRLATESWAALALGSVLLGAGVLSPNRTLMVIAVSLGGSLLAALVPMLGALAFAVVPAQQRAAMSATLASTLTAGALVGVIYATSFDDRHGPRSALVAMAVLGLFAAIWWRATSGSLPADQRRVVEAVADRRTHEAALAAGGHSPLLECHGISFSYGSLQVLFDIDFTIDDGEVVGLLGTNGAGKSTLLRVISGIGLPQRGSVRLSGNDITYMDAEERVRAGITQIPGGRAIFGPMTVIENLQSFGYTLGRDRHRIDEAIERCLEAFPRLRERRSSLAATLSGGEQQMVGLSKALILQPRLLLIDELSLGLAPVVVGPLLDMVRRINSDGTAVVIVEQSVNIALSLVDHVYFMEKGTMRFDGRAADLLDRHDLLRAVFLQGAAKGTLA
jgi:ABC-type branched-subunit amino acid transport system ATPase component